MLGYDKAHQFLTLNVSSNYLMMYIIVRCKLSTIPEELIIQKLANDPCGARDGQTVRQKDQLNAYIHLFGRKVVDINVS